MPERKTSSKVLSKVSSRVADKLKKSNSHIIQYPKNGDKYGRSNRSYRLHMIPGYDLMQYNIVVRPYIIRKYGIEDSDTLDVLLYLFPIQYFTGKDFAVMRPFIPGLSFKSLKANGYVELVVSASERVKSVYRLTDRSVDIVMEYYQYLSGEKVFDPIAQGNPFDYEGTSEANAKRQQIIEHCTKLQRSKKWAFRGLLGPKAISHDT